MTVLTASKISTASITDEQIGACHLVLHSAGNFYKVANSAGKVDDNGDLIEYTVRFNGIEKGFSCTCKAIGLCWHIKASIAAAKEEREAVAELNKQIAVQAAMSDPATIKAAEVAAEAPVKVARKSSAKAYQPKAFSILR